ncbi:terminase TerL endonuclease subunit [Clostridium sp. AWRP]|uniref:terminase large subunit n=1 Tax=Clostridium sp. AWRP TaxID=2212991 RepID=UPI000FD8C12E|nr:terminase TerL endonuclease subunit [Clostridium sp. AWRP]AZV56792.1 terminase large subunit [Clostridium sp. AWRP]
MALTLEDNIKSSTCFTGTLKEQLIEYCNRILNNKIVACTKHKWACKRFLNDLSKENTQGFPYAFDENQGQRAIDWLQEFKHSKGELAGTKIEAHIFVKFVLGNVYGWINVNTGYRRFERMYEQVGRKNAKSQTLASIATYELCAYGVAGSEVYCLAPVSKQAKAVFNEACNMIRGHRILRRKLKIRESTNEIIHRKSNSVMTLFTKDDLKKGDSYNPQLAVIDEYHLFDTSEPVDTMESGMGARYNPLIAIITTAGRKVFCPCKEEYDYCSKVINPYINLNDDKYFIIICEVGAKEDPFDIMNVIKANPVVSTYETGLNKLKEKMNTAKEREDKRLEFFTKQCNIWVNQKSKKAYMNMQKWDECRITQSNVDILEGLESIVTVDDSDKIKFDLRGLKCVVGIDKSDKIDLTSTTFEFDLGNDKVLVLNHCFIPEDTLEAKKKTDKVPYDLWCKQGYITKIPGAKIKNEYIVDYILDQKKKYDFDIDSIAYDPWHCDDIAREFESLGILVIEIPQTYASLSEPTKDFRAKVYAKEVLHNGNPVLTYCMSNALEDPDRKENIKLYKEKDSSERIDAAVSTTISHVRMVALLDNSTGDTFYSPDI